MFADFGFWKVAWLSPTFRESLLSAGLFFLIFFSVAYLGLRIFTKIGSGSKSVTHQSAWLALSQDKSGSANAVDFVLVMPFFMFMMCLFVQMSMIVNASLIVHYAAYSAARTARVHYCNRSVLAYPVGFASCNTIRAENAADKAARYVLIAASPVDSSIPSNGSPPGNSLQWLADQYLERKSPIMLQARYAFDSRNVDVQVRPAVSLDPFIAAQLSAERLPSFGPGSGPNTLTDSKLLNAWPVTVKVEYVKHLGVPLVGPFLSNVRRGNNHFRTIDAEITLL